MTSQGKAIQSIEVQISQMATTMNAMQKEKFTNCPKRNPKKDCKVITRRSGKNVLGLIVFYEDE